MGQPLLGHILMLHVWVEVELIQGLEEERAQSVTQSIHFQIFVAVQCHHDDHHLDYIAFNIEFTACKINHSS